MYLVHACLRPPASTEPPDLPPGLAAALMSAACPRDRLEHVSVHARALPWPVLGLHLLADSLATAESVAARLVLRLLAERQDLAGWTLVGAQVPLSPLLSAAFHAAHEAPGRNRPGPLPSIRNLFQDG